MRSFILKTFPPYPQIEEDYKGEKIDRGDFYQADPTGTRTGNGVGPHLTETMERVAVDTEAVLNKVNDIWYDAAAALFPLIL